MTLLKVKEYSKEALKFFHLPTEEKKKFSLPPENKWIGGWYPIGRLRWYEQDLNYRSYNMEVVTTAYIAPHRQWFLLIKRAIALCLGVPPPIFDFTFKNIDFTLEVFVSPMFPLLVYLLANVGQKLDMMTSAVWKGINNEWLANRDFYEETMYVPFTLYIPPN